MSTDDSISEDVSSSGALSHCPDGDGGKESETSLLSSEATSASGLVVSDERHTTSQTTGATVESRPVDITPSCRKIRSLCLSTDERFVQDKRLPFINPSSLETLRALVQEIQNSGETDPEIWKDCQGRWLHLFRLVEKQYQDQILAQQEQYQCQIQLIQDEIKAMVQLQNRQASNQSHAEFPPNLPIQTCTSRKGCISPLFPDDSTGRKNPAGERAPAFPSHALPLQGSEPADQSEERAPTGLSSGYGTLFAREAGVDVAGSPRGDEGGNQERETQNGLRDAQQNRGTTVGGNQQGCPSEGIVRVEEPNPFVYQQGNSGISRPLTSWAQRQKLRVEKSKKARPSSHKPDCKEPPRSLEESPKPNLPQWPESQEQEPLAGPASSSFPLLRSDSVISQASGLTYWHPNENEPYHPLPDSFDSGAYLLLHEASTDLSLTQDPPLSLKEIYHNKQRTGSKHSDCEGVATVSSLSLQMPTLDPPGNQRQSERTSGFTSPSHFSSPSFHLCLRVHTPASPDSVGEYSPNPADTDAISDTSSVSAARPSKAQSTWGFHNKAQPPSHTSSQQRRVSAPLASEEEGSNTHTSTLTPCPGPAAAQGSAASPQMGKTSALEDPVVLSLVRQRLREKHARHVADLKAYYETEIQLLQDKLKLGELPEDVEKANQSLTKRCKRLEKALSEATRRVQDLEATNSSLEKKLAEWPERYAVAAAAVKSLQQRLDESKRSEKEKEATVARLKSHARQLEEALQTARREGGEKDSKSEREYKMLQDLLGEYESLRREHQELKNNFVSTENKLCNANDQISDLKRLVFKLETQVKQLEHENQARARLNSHSSTRPPGAGVHSLFHHPDVLPWPSRGQAEPDVSSRESPSPEQQQQHGGRKPKLLQTNQSCVHNKQPSGAGSSADASPLGCNWSSASEGDHSLAQPRYLEQSSQRREKSGTLTPMMRALIELEEAKATESRAPWGSTHRTMTGFVERRHKDDMQQRLELQEAEREAVKPGEARAERGLGGAQIAAARLRAQRSLSPESHRSSSLPPAHRNGPPTTPTKRETLLVPQSAKSSPKRCPTENFSTVFGSMMPREEYLLKGADEQQRRHSFHSSSPRKRLQFLSADRGDVAQQLLPGSVRPAEGSSQQGWEEPGARPGSPAPPQDRLHSLAEAERLLDELTQEKMQIEAALSQLPRTGGKVSAQARIDEAALEKRLERVNRDLGSIRMTLKRFRVLRSSANI